ncbi:MAG: hypothetical protein JO212_12265 [Acetobacteraceae bacterium]|nr:hypothetical protein [Acetobacteraceae bacterium]
MHVGRFIIARRYRYAVEEIAPPDIEAVIANWHCIGSTDVAAWLGPNMEKYADEDAKISFRLWQELVPPADLPTLLSSLARRDWLLRQWLTFMRRYPIIVMPTMCDLPPPHGLDLTKQGFAQLLESLRVSLIAPALGLPSLAVPVGTHGRLRPGAQILAGRFREDLCLEAGEVIEAA